MARNPENGSAQRYQEDPSRTAALKELQAQGGTFSKEAIELIRIQDREEALAGDSQNLPGRKMSRRNKGILIGTGLGAAAFSGVFVWGLTEMVAESSAYSSGIHKIEEKYAHPTQAEEEHARIQINLDNAKAKVNPQKAEELEPEIEHLNNIVFQYKENQSKMANEIKILEKNTADEHPAKEILVNDFIGLGTAMAISMPIAYLVDKSDKKKRIGHKSLQLNK